MAVLAYPDGSFMYASWVEWVLHEYRDWTSAEDLAVWLTMGIGGLCGLITIAGCLSRGDKRLWVDMVFTVSLWVLVIVQLMSIYPAAVRLPRYGGEAFYGPDTPSIKTGWFTEKCIASTKGGRVAFPKPFKRGIWEHNPCHCKLPAVCMGTYRNILTKKDQFVETLCRECIPNWESEQFLNPGLHYQYCNKSQHWTWKPEKDCVVDRNWCPEEASCNIPDTGCFYTEAAEGKFKGSVPILEAVAASTLMQCQDKCCAHAQCKGVQFEAPTKSINASTSSTSAPPPNCILLTSMFDGNNFKSDQHTLLSNRVPARTEVPVKYENMKRDCDRMQGEYCTPAEPCTPCEMETLMKFPGVWGEKFRCQKCSATNTGDCDFVDNIGPYCKRDPFGREIVPCKRCCSEDPITRPRDNTRVVCS
jgi:hypothetical protein